MITIYALSDPRTNARRYIGKTTKSLGTRVSGHLAAARRSPRDANVRGWLIELMAANIGPRAEVLEVVPDHLGDVAEVLWIAQHRQLGTDLLNHGRGGKGNKGSRRSESLRQRVGEWSRQQWATRRVELIAKQNAGKGDTWLAKQRIEGQRKSGDAAFRKKISESQRRRLASPEAREMMRRVSQKKLTDADVIRIRALLADGRTQQGIAKQYGVNACQISRIHTGHRRKHVA